jgi:hypothetical protein
MEDIFFAILIILSINDMNVNGLNKFNQDYMDLKYTSSLRGIFVWLIILSHHNSYYKNFHYLYSKIINCLNQKIVKYVKNLPKKALILYIKFLIIIFLFFLSNSILKLKYNMIRYFLSMIFISDVGNSNWFAFTIIIFYIYSYISFIYIKNISRHFLGIIYINIIIKKKY